MITMEKKTSTELHDELMREFRSLTDAEKQTVLDELKKLSARKKSLSMIESRD